MPKPEALSFKRPTAADFESAFQQLYQIDGGKSKFDLMIDPDKPLMEREQVTTLSEQDEDSDNGNDDGNDDDDG